MDSAAAAVPAPDFQLERVSQIKERLTTLRSWEAELDVKLSDLDVQHAIKLRELQAAHMEAVEMVMAKREAVQAEIEAAESDLEEAVNAPVSGDRDPTEWLPDEVMLMVLERLPFATLWGGVCEQVCRRWARLMESAAIVRRKRDERWAAYEVGTIKPRCFDGHTGIVWALVVGLDGKVYSGSADKTIMVWSGESGAHLQTLKGHTSAVSALAVGLDGNICSGSDDCTVRVWSGESGEHVRTLKGHVSSVLALAVQCAEWQDLLWIRRPNHPSVGCRRWHFHADTCGPHKQCRSACRRQGWCHLLGLIRCHHQDVVRRRWHPHPHSRGSLRLRQDARSGT
jgi:hypothetical protein